MPQESRIIFQEKEKSRLDAAQARRLTRLQSSISTVKYGDNDDNDADDNEGVGDDEYPSPPSSAPWPSNKNLMAAKWLGIVKNFQRLHTLFKVLEKHRKFTAKYELESVLLPPPSSLSSSSCSMDLGTWPHESSNADGEELIWFLKWHW